MSNNPKAEDPKTLTLENFSKQILRPTCVKAFGRNAVDAFEKLIADGASLDEAADIALAIAQAEGYIS